MAPWLALLRLHVSRIMPHWRGMTVLNTILVALFTSIERGGLDELLQFASAAAASFLFLPPAMVAKARHDGAFRFLAHSRSLRGSTPPAGSPSVPSTPCRWPRSWAPASSAPP
jgi:hypothetical protein